MTEYGRGQEGSEPWHPQDPYYGDGGWEGQQAPMGQQAAYGGQPQHYPHEPQQSEYGDWDTGRQADQGQAQQQYQQQYDPQQSYDQQQYVPQQHQQYDGQNQYDSNGWGAGTPTQVPYTDPSDPYGQQAAVYATGEQPDYYGTPDAYPPPEPPSRRRTEPEPQQTDWDPGPDQGEHAFFAGGGGADEDADDTGDPGAPGGRGDRRGRGGKKPKKRRSGCACLVVLLVFGGGIGGVGYFGYQFYQDRFAPAPDYAGDGTGERVVISIPKGANGTEMGRRLELAGVVKSVDAFVAAFTQNKKAGQIQAGTYLLNKQMSAESAVELMLDPKSQNNVLVKPGERNLSVYKAIDKKLDLSSGTTKKVAEAKYKSLGLPDWADSNDDIKDPLEGFLYPGTYGAAKGMKPETVLKEMVGRAASKYASLDLEAKAEALKLDNPLQLVTVASLVQAEGKTAEDYRKMAEVVYNRLDPANPETYGALQFDSTYNYLKNESNIDVTESEVKENQDPYNTYKHKGLPPGPIDNPGDEAMESVLNPTHDGWYYFVATDGVNTTEFAKTLAEFNKLKDKFNESRGN
ncbi:MULTISPECIES: endolytic transglycosylase MltG [unclassified Streptomyces]|uniref:endolytic transglycosylase MltG n=1 Tax=unclassified Streptomyces TaxID=2593676 RepID=UPI0036E820F7